MKLIKKLDELNIGYTQYSLIIGNFDGVHNGHAAIIKNILKKNKKENLKLIVITFIPHPEKIINKKKSFLINTYEERRTILEKYNIDYLIELKFNKNMQKISAEVFFKKILSKIKNLKKVYVGYDFKIGLNRSGNIEDLKKYLFKKNISIAQLSQIKGIDNKDISSSRVRDNIRNGEIEKANKLLGRAFFIKGNVVSGKKRGRVIGFPTANLNYGNDRIIPCPGVYFTKIILKEKKYHSITNISNNPTFNEIKISIESFIIDFNQNIYNEQISLYFLKKHRDVIKFNDVEELKIKILNDVKKAKKYFLK